MKLFKLIVLILFAGFLNAGCATSTASPEQLIKNLCTMNKKQI
ncbi:hypothetical protein Q5M85_15415 [Paraclostridium bifermentans]|nr:hypothetical protein [Paraclostridium bifermentans]